MIVRIFETTIEPDDVERGKQLFREHVIPAFDVFEGCHGIDMYLGLDEHSGDLVTMAAISRWDSMAAIEAATGRPEYERALSEIRGLFQQTPIVRHFETVD